MPTITYYREAGDETSDVVLVAVEQGEQMEPVYYGMTEGSRLTIGPIDFRGIVTTLLYLEMCTEVPEAEAREIHPELFTYLEANHIILQKA